MSKNSQQTLSTIIFIVLILLAIFIAYKIIRHYLKKKTEVITAFTGGLGSGKTCLSVDIAKRLLKKNQRKLRRKLKWRKRRNKWLFWLPKKPEIYEEPILISNIPVIVVKRSRLWQWIRVHILRKERKLDVYSVQLTKEMLLIQGSFPKGSVILLDEIGAWANQMRFNDPNIIDTFDEFVRFYRHYYAIEDLNIEPYMVVNDQCSENINYVIRRRLNMVHNLSNFLLLGKLAFYYERIICISEEIKTIDMRTGMENDTQDNSNFRWKWCISKGCYDSHCYSGRVAKLPRALLRSFTKKKTNELLRCPTFKEQPYYPKVDNKDND